MNCSFFARPKNEPKKGAENDNFSLFLRSLHMAFALLRHEKGYKFTPFSVCHRTCQSGFSPEFKICDIRDFHEIAFQALENRLL